MWCYSAPAESVQTGTRTAVTRVSLTSLIPPAAHPAAVSVQINPSLLGALLLSQCFAHVGAPSALLGAVQGRKLPKELTLTFQSSPEH